MKPTHIATSSSRSGLGNETPGTVYTAEHDLLSIALSTNFEHPEIEPVVCFVRKGDSPEDEEKVMDQGVEYMLKVQKLVREYLTDEFRPYMEHLHQKITTEKQLEDELVEQIPGLTNDTYEDAEEEEEEEEEVEPARRPNKRDKKEVRLDQSPLVRLREDLLKWIEQIPVLAFQRL